MTKENKKQNDEKTSTESIKVAKTQFLTDEFRDALSDEEIHTLNMDFRKGAEIEGGRIWKNAFEHSFIIFHMKYGNSKAYVRRNGEISIYRNNQKIVLGNINDLKWKEHKDFFPNSRKK